MRLHLLDIYEACNLGADSDLAGFDCDDHGAVGEFSLYRDGFPGNKPHIAESVRSSRAAVGKEYLDGIVLIELREISSDIAGIVIATPAVPVTEAVTEVPAVRISGVKTVL